MLLLEWGLFFFLLRQAAANETWRRERHERLRIYQTNEMMYVDNYLVQAQVGRGRDHHSYNWIQRRDCGIQEYLFHRVGCRRTGQGEFRIPTIIFFS